MRPATEVSGPRPAAVVLLSGGMDSATCMAVAREAGYRLLALSFDYGQRHAAELDAARSVARAFDAERHQVLRLDLAAIGGSALTDAGIPVPEPGGNGIPVTYVPARNTIFLACALGWAEVNDADAIYAGMNAVDYSGYPDCRPEYVDAFRTLSALATQRGVEGRPIRVETPLLKLSKAQIIRLGERLGVDYALTVSCYRAAGDGAACGACDACALRRQGFLAAGVTDPTRYRR